ncbi:DUF5133 domain-containing protein [Streptomyces pratensis]|uniref:DUF5133 domain-containing protein n=1 Tax=Streptomyces pratensis TaxID=1169025 RepID=UPI0037B43C28
MAHPSVLEELLRRYEALHRSREEPQEPGPDAAEVLRRIEDVSYTLCVSTGTRDVAAALVAAREQVRHGTNRQAVPPSAKVLSAVTPHGPEHPVPSEAVSA